MAMRWWVEHESRRIEVEPESPWSGYVVRLFADGEQIGEVKGNARKLTVEGDGISVMTWVAWHGASIQRAELIPADGGTPIPLEPAPGTRAARREAWAKDHPGLYAARHAASGVGQVLIGLLGLAALLRFLPDISIDLPSIDLPLPSIDLPLPSIDAPDVSLPDITLPAWLRAFLASSRYWIPILVGIALALGEYDRRKRHARERAEREAAALGPGAAGAAGGPDAAVEPDTTGGPGAADGPDTTGEPDTAREAQPADVMRADRR